MHAYQLNTILISTLVIAPALASEMDEIMVVSANRHQVAINELPGTVQQLTEQELANTQAQHIQQALVQIAGVTFSRGDGVEYLPGLRSPVQTGAGACGSILSAIDGIPLRAAGFCNINELFEAPTELGASLEILSGPWSAVYGSNALTGVINVLTPGFDSGSRLSLTASSNDYYQLNLLNNADVDDHNLLIGLSHTNDGGYRDSSGYNQQKLLFKHGTSVAGLTLVNTLNASRLDQQTAAYLEGKDSYKDELLSKTNSAPDAYRKANSIRLTSSLSSDNGSINWQINPYLRHANMAFLQHFLPGTPVEENQHTSIGVQTSLQYDWLDAGIDVEWTHGELLQYQYKPTEGSAFLEATIPQGKHYDYQVDSLLISPYIQANFNLSEQLIATVAGRFDYQSYDYQNQMNSGRVDEQGNTCGFGGCRYARPESSKDSFSHFSPKFGLSYQLSTNQQLYSNLSRGHRAPQATELYRLQRAQTKAELTSETIDSFELGWRGATPSINWQLTAYLMQRDNLILRDSDYFNVSGGNTKHKGIEGAFKLALSQSIHWQLNASYANHEYGEIAQLGDVKGNKVDSAPAVNASSQVNWQVLDSLAATLEWIYVDEYFTDIANEHKYEGHQLVNLRSQWQINQSLQLRAKVDNLLDTRYAERADFSHFSGDRYFPGRDRQWLVSVQYQY
ncbi:TonB-dependent receptor [Paraferrimonas sp. SM1919]|uniref:TonB-dependent receptor n=1 Tax=Paraferrimonas sp. SM1919 TaxID=2662263 RepID=UPI0013D34E0F|nr:TonB-dependent receptor [Paraferrimonas sp. SM1919]